MTRAYQVDSGSECAGDSARAGQPGGADWLSALQDGHLGPGTVLTPYANVDVSALVHSGLTGDITSAYSTGDAVADTVLHGSFTPSMAFPPGGTADLSVLTTLATAEHIGTVVLDSSEIAREHRGLRARRRGHLGPDRRRPDHDRPARRPRADQRARGGRHGSGVLAPSTQFAVSQRFLAETAMIAAEAPDSDRSIVVAPPEDWSPSAALASELLSETTSTPWLAPATVGSLARSPGQRRLDRPPAPPANRDSPGELSASYLSRVSAVGTQLDVYSDLLSQPSAPYLQGLDEALIATESSAWRGGGAAQGLALADKLSSFMSGEESRITIIAAPQVPMGGSSGLVPVSVQNGSHQAIQVRLNAGVVSTPNRPSQLTVGRFQNLITVQPQAGGDGPAAGQLGADRADATSGSASAPRAANRCRPPTSLTVESTRYGRAILFLIGAAIGVLVLTSVFRGIRRWLHADAQSVPEERLHQVAS